MTDISSESMDFLESVISTKIENAASRVSKSKHKAKVLSVDSDGTVWVTIPGMAERLPVMDKTVEVTPEEYVDLEIDNIAGTAIIVGNLTNPGLGVESPLDGEKLKYGTVAGDAIAENTITGRNIQDSTITGSKFEDGTITGSKIAESTITGSRLMDGTISGSKIAESTITGSKIDASTFEDGQISGTAIDTSTFTNGSISGSAIDTSTFTNGSISGTAIDTSTFTNGSISGAAIDSSTLTNIPYASIVDADVEVASIADAQIADATINQAQVANLTADLAAIGTAIAGKASIGDLEAAEAEITNLQADTAKIHNLTANQLSAATGYIGDLSAANISAQDIIADHTTVGNLDATYATIEDLTAAEADIANLQAGKADISVLESDYIDADTIEANYAQVDFSNVTASWISNGTIANAAITDAMIHDVSANRLTAGTIDASKISVTNLQAENISVKKINGQTVAGKSVVDALAQHESDISDLDSKIDDEVEALNDRIDGAIESHTGNAVPTLQNTPASSWNTNDLKDEHVGDVYYVVNSSIPQNGYCYRFTKSDGNYSWQLIKDSDVTAALQRLQTAEGAIGTIQQFDTTVSSFMTDTDEELSSLKTRTSTVETSVQTAQTTANGALVETVQLWFTKADTTAPSKPNAHVTSTATTGNAWTTKVPVYSSSYPHYYYCYEYKKADGSYAWSSVIHDEATCESQAQGRKGVSDAAAAASAAATADGKAVAAQNAANTADGKAVAAQNAAETADGKAVAAQNTANKNVKESIQLWFTKANDTAPAKPAAAVTSTATTGNAWTTKVPAYSSTYPKYFYCWQYKLADNTYSWSDVVEDKAMAEVQSTSRTAATNASNALSQLTTKVETSVFNEVKQTVDENSNSITTLSSTTQQLRTDVDGKASQSDLTSLSTTVNTVRQTADSNSSSITQLTTTTQTLREELNNMEIGGRNLLKNSSDFTDWHLQNASISDGIATINATNDAGCRIYQMPAEGYWTWQPNTKYTVSIDAKGLSDSTFMFDPYGGNAAGKNVSVTTSWARYSYTFVSGSSVTTGSMSFYNAGSANIQVKHPKLELGTVATDWSPAPEDVESDLETFKTTTTNKFNTVDQTLDGINTSIGNIQNTVSQKADGSTVTNLSSQVNTINETVSGHTQSIQSINSTVSTKADKSAAVAETTQLWFSKSNTTAPSKPTAHVTSTSTGGNAWTTVVPAYSASYPHYFYCYEWKFVDGTYGWSSIVHDEATCEAQERARTAITNAAAADTKAGNAATAAGNAQTTANANIKSTVQLWFTKANETAPSKPTAHVTTNNAATGNAWNLAVPTYNASYPKYFYCYEYQKGDGTYAWSDAVFDRATTENQYNSRAAQSSVSTLQQDYANFKQTVETFESTVGSTYATKEELSDVSDGAEVTKTQEGSEGKRTIVTDGAADLPLLTLEPVYGESVQDEPILPDGYVQLEYLSNSAYGVYVDTGIIPKIGYGFEIKFYATSDLNGSSYGCIFGGRISSVDADYQLTTYGSDNGGGTLRWGGTSYSSMVGIEKNTVQVASLHSGVYTNPSGSTMNISSTKDGEYSLYLFSLNQSGTSVQSQAANARIYYLKIYNASNILVNYLVPAKRVSGNVLGFYDLVTNAFKTPNGTLIAGPTQTLPSPEYPVRIKSVGHRNLLDFGISETTINGITFTQLLDGGIKVVGTATAMADLVASNAITVPEGFYAISATGLMSGMYLITSGSNGNGYPYTEVYPTRKAFNGRVWDGSKPFSYFLIRVNSGTTVNTVVYPQLEHNSSPNKFVPYGKVPIKSVMGRNIFDSSILALPNGWTENNGAYTGWSNDIYRMFGPGMYFGYLPVSIGLPYTGRITVSYDYTSENQSYVAFYIYARYSDGTSGWLTASNSNGHYSGTTVANKTVTSFFVTYGSGARFTLSNVMFNVGDTELPYEPYQETVTYLDLIDPSTGDPVELHGLDSTYRDILTIDASGHAVVEKRTKKVVWDDIVNFSTNSSRVNVSTNANNDVVVPTASEIPLLLATHLVPHIWSGTTFPGTSFLNPANGAIGWNFEPGVASTLAELKALYPDVYSIHPLKEPYTIDLGYVDLPEVTDGSTVYVAAEVQPVIGGTWWTPAGYSLGKFRGSYEERVSNQETSIQQTKAQVAIKANSSDVYTKTQTDGLITTEVNNRNAAITAASDSITSTVSSTYATKAQATSVRLILKRDNWTDTTWSQNEVIGSATTFTNAHYNASGASSSTGFDVTTLKVGDIVQVEGVSSDTKSMHSITFKVTSVPTSSTANIPVTCISSINTTATSSRLSTAESKITQHDTDISLRVTKTEFDNLEIGGRNLLLNSGDLTKWSKESGVSAEWDSTSSMYKVTDSVHTSSRYGIFQDIDVEPSTEYTFSVWVKAGNTTASGCVGNGTVWPAVRGSDANGVKTPVKFTWTTESDTVKARVYLCLACSSTAGNYGYFLNPKLEKGAKATDWTPAPEDMATSAELKVTTDGISSEVSKISSVKYVISGNSSGATLAQIAEWTAEGTNNTWSTSGDISNVRIGDTVYIKYKDGTRDTYVYVKGTVNAIGNGSLTITAHGYEDVLPVETIKSTINQSSDSVKIQAKHVEIDGSTVFRNSSTSTTTLSNYVSGIADTAVDNLEIGGRNLLGNTAVSRQGTATTYGAWDVLQSTYSGDYLLDLDAGDYVLSFDWSASEALPDSFFVWIGYGNTSGYGVADIAGLQIEHVGKGKSSGHVIKKFTWPDANSDNPYFACRPIRSSTTNGLTGITFTITNAKLEKGTVATDWEPAPEDIVSEEQYIYKQAVSGTSSMPENTTWVTATGESTSSDTAGLTPVWTTKRPTYRSNYPVIFVAKQSKNGVGTVTCTTPVKDDTTTVIDGGHITTGTIDANRISSTVVNAINANVSDTINANKINVSQITIGQSQVTNLSTALNAKTDKTIPDTRNDNQPPSWYFTNYPSQTITEFKYVTTIGLTGSATYCSLVTIVPWGNSSGGWPRQSTNVAGKSYHRIATDANTWGAWKSDEETATTYITAIDNNGIKVHAANNPTTNYQAITAEGSEIYKGGTSVAQFGESTRLGKKAAMHSVIDGDSFDLFTDSNDTNSIFHVGYPTGATITDTFVGDGTTKAYILSQTPSGTVTVTLDGTSTTAWSRSGTTLTFTTAPGDGVVIAVSYPTADYIPYYSLGVRSNSPGKYSTAEGFQTTASGNFSHAEGDNTKASGNRSHAEGYITTASGKYSHAEGTDTIASGSGSHAEGNGTTAKGDYSHAEGANGLANGPGTHVEGSGTEAYFSDSHAEGTHSVASGKSSHAQNLWTIAGAEAQTALGKYNSYNSSDSVAIILGNGTGTSSTDRHNALTVDFDGWITTSLSKKSAFAIDSSTNNNVSTTELNGLTFDNIRVGQYLATDKNYVDAGGMVTHAFADGSVKTIVGAYNKNTSGSDISNEFEVVIEKSGTKSYKVGSKPEFRKAIDAPGYVTANGYGGLVAPDGTDTSWIRTPQSGLIPYASGGSSSSLGTSSWPFQNIYGKNIYHNGTKLGTLATKSSGSVSLTVENKSATSAANSAAIAPNDYYEYEVSITMSSGHALAGITRISKSGTGASALGIAGVNASVSGQTVTVTVNGRNYHTSAVAKSAVTVTVHIRTIKTSNSVTFS